MKKSTHQSYTKNCTSLKTCRRQDPDCWLKGALYISVMASRLLVRIPTPTTINRGASSIKLVVQDKHSSYDEGRFHLSPAPAPITPHTASYIRSVPSAKCFLLFGYICYWELQLRLEALKPLWKRERSRVRGPADSTAKNHQRHIQTHVAQRREER